MFGHCFECGVGPIDIVLHHVIPKSQGGKAMIPLCESCHNKVHGLDMSYSQLRRSSLRSKMNIQRLWEKRDRDRSWMRGKRMTHIPTGHNFVCISTRWAAKDLIAIRIKPYDRSYLPDKFGCVSASVIEPINGHPDHNPDYVWAKDCVLFREI